ncbi:MAG: asparaginase [Fibrobacteres bacterium]|nr:asparaginase [Fibrobacterota bacterium]
MEMTGPNEEGGHRWDEGAAPLLTQLRGGEPDLSHRGFACLVDAAGKCLWSLGDPHVRAFFRSSAKPFQALAMVESGAADAAGLDDADLAIVCGSHAGGPDQVERVRSLLSKSGLGPDALGCGDGLADQCSGKHAGMLTACRHLKLPLDTYLHRDHPWQRRMLAVTCEWCAADAEAVPLAVDGCSAPTFSLPVYNMALGFARLARAAADPGPVARLLRAMAAHPAHTGEPDMGGFALRGRAAPLPAAFVTKLGANGVHCAAVPGLGLGFAMKVADGASAPRWPVLTRAFELAGLIDAKTAAAMRERLWPRVETRRGEPAGQLRLEF